VYLIKNGVSSGPVNQESVFFVGESRFRVGLAISWVGSWESDMNFQSLILLIWKF